MNKNQGQRFEKAGWKVGSTAEFLGLTSAEEAVVEAKLRLADVVRSQRIAQGLTQAQLASRMGSRQPRIARLENRDPETTLDFQIKALFAANPANRADFRRLVDKWVRSGAKTRSAAARRKAVGVRAKASASVARKVKL
jgi:transcriptional regulator with XRE-family HTH domain